MSPPLSLHPPSRESAPGPELKFWTGEFVDPDVEVAYLRHANEHLVGPTIRAVVIPAALTFIAWGWVDWMVVPEAWDHAWKARYLFASPWFVFLAVLAFLKSWQRFLPLIRWSALLVPQTLFLFIARYATDPGKTLYELFIIYFFNLVPGLVKASVRQVVTVGVLSVAGVALHYAAVPSSMLVVVFVIGAVILTLSWAAIDRRYGEASDRRAYWRERVIIQQHAIIDQERAEVERLLLNILPLSIAKRLRAGEEAIADRLEGVTVLFADIAGFTEYASTVTAEELVGRLNEIFVAFDRLAIQHGLEKIKTIGDCYMVVGGAPHSADGTAEAVAEMALSMQKVIAEQQREHGTQLAIRIGFHTGPVVAGVIGERKFVYDLWGDTVNLASRMESSGEVGRIQVSDASRALLDHSYVFVDGGEKLIKGKGSQRTWFLVGRSDGAGPMSVRLATSAV